MAALVILVGSLSIFLSILAMRGAYLNSRYPDRPYFLRKPSD